MFSCSHLNCGPVNHLGLLLISDRYTNGFRPLLGIGVLGNVSFDSFGCFPKFLQL